MPLRNFEAGSEAYQEAERELANISDELEQTRTFICGQVEDLINPQTGRKLHRRFKEKLLRERDIEKFFELLDPILATRQALGDMYGKFREYQRLRKRLAKERPYRVNTDAYREHEGLLRRLSLIYGEPITFERIAAAANGGISVGPVAAQDLLPAKDAASPEDLLIAKENNDSEAGSAREALEILFRLAGLTSREMQILKQRFFGDRVVTYEMLASTITHKWKGKTKTYSRYGICLIEQAGIKKLRDFARAYGFTWKSAA